MAYKIKRRKHFTLVDAKRQLEALEMDCLRKQQLLSKVSESIQNEHLAKATRELESAKHDIEEIKAQIKELEELARLEGSVIAG